VLDSFVDQDGRDRVGLFHGGPKAAGVPFGKYRVALHADISYLPTTFDVEVAASDVLITPGLEWGGVENIRITGRLRGNLVGFPSTSQSWWCKASGLYLRSQYESRVLPETLVFDFGDVAPGFYSLACLADDKLVVFRIVRINAGSTPITVEYRRGGEDRLP
jgi:hypothetical protein